MSNFVMSQEIVEKVGIEPIADTGTAITGPWMDRKANESILMKGYTGLATGSPTGQTTDFKLQDADDIAGGGVADVAGEVLTQIVADSGDEKKDVDARGIRQFVRMVCTTVLTAGTSPTLPVAGFLIFGNAKETPNPA